MDFRKVTAIIRPACLEKVEEALRGLGVPGLKPQNSNPPAVE